MFRKPHRVKTSNTMKGSEKRLLRSNLENRFPNFRDEVKSLFSNKSEINQVKAMTHSGRTIVIYYFDGNPMFFFLDDVLYPTLYVLWKYLDFLPVITTLPAVLDKICNGADLMAPGIVVNESTMQEMMPININDICAIKILGNKSPVAVGVSLLSSNELCTDGTKGKAVTIIHAYNDNLWSSGSGESLPLNPESLIDEICDELENLEISENTEVICDDIEENTPDKESNSVISEVDSVVLPDNSVPEYTMDEILYHSFMVALKCYGKKIQLPILTSTFYSSYVLKSCPPELNLDIKKTTHKKLSVFLKKMNKEGVIYIKELTKGVESIVNINLENEVLKTFRPDTLFKNHIDMRKEEKPKEDDTTNNIQEKYKFPHVTELFVVTAQVKKIFELFSVKKGDTVPASKVKEVIRLYVKDNNLQSETSPREVTLDPLLSDCVLKKSDGRTTMTWEDIFDAMTRNMTHAYEVTFENKEPMIKKGKLEPIKITVDIRTGNKKVTLIQNLETYGLNPEKIAHHVQVTVAASTSVAPAQNGKGTSVLIQGNQVLYLQKLLIDILKVPRKYIQGLENIPAKKK